MIVKIHHIDFKHIVSGMSSVSPNCVGNIKSMTGNISFIIYLRVSYFFHSRISIIILSYIWTFKFVNDPKHLCVPAYLFQFFLKKGNLACV